MQNVGLGLFLLCGWPLMLLAFGVWIGRNVSGVRSPFVRRNKNQDY